MNNLSFNNNFGHIDVFITQVSDEQGGSCEGAFDTWLITPAACGAAMITRKASQCWLHYQRQEQSGGLSFPVQVNVEGRRFKPHVRVLKGILKNGTLILGQSELPVEGRVPDRNQGRRSWKRMLYQATMCEYIEGSLSVCPVGLRLVVPNE